MNTELELIEGLIDGIEEEELEEKVCNTCEISWPLDIGFYDDKNTKDGKCAQCKQCRDAKTRENEERRLNEPMSPAVEAMSRLYTARFHAIKEAGLSVDKGGVAMANKIDDLLERCNLGEGRVMQPREKPMSETIITYDKNRFKGGNKPRRVTQRDLGVA